MRRESRGIREPEILMRLALVAIAFLCLLPFILIISGSLTSEAAIRTGGFRFVPQEWSVEAYRYLSSSFDQIVSGYQISAIMTVGGTAIALAVTALLAYPMSRKDLRFRGALAIFAFITMVFHGGMVPWYIVLTRYLGLRDTILALILPYTITAWNLFLLRNFLQTIPSEIHESAKMDGAGELTIFLRMILPLAKPGLATVGLFIALRYWNDWWLGLMLINKEALYPLQLLLRRIVSNIQFLRNAPAEMTMINSSNLLPAEGVKMATTVVTIGPIVLLYPFVQRYFIKGLTVGAIKG